MALGVPADTMRARFHASLLKGSVVAEEAEFGFWGHRVRTGGADVDWPNDVQFAAEGIRDRWNEHITAKNMFPQSVRLDFVQVDHLAAANGAVLDQGVALFDGDDAWRGTETNSLPWECALAISFYGYTPGTFTQNKGRKRGRMYLPPLAANTLSGGDGQFSDGLLQQLVPMFVAFFNDVQGMELPGAGPLTGDYWDLVVVSRGTPDKILTPTAYPITRIQADTKIDSQRRRERQQDANNVSFGAVAHS